MHAGNLVDSKELNQVKIFYKFVYSLFCLCSVQLILFVQLHATCNYSVFQGICCRFILFADFVCHVDYC